MMSRPENVIPQIDPNITAKVEKIEQNLEKIERMFPDQEEQGYTDFGSDKVLFQKDLDHYMQNNKSFMDSQKQQIDKVAKEFSEQLKKLQDSVRKE